jgi:hypothetical protein
MCTIYAFSSECCISGECDGSYISDAGNVNWKSNFQHKMREMTISFHVLVEGLAHIFFLNMPRWYDGSFCLGLNILLLINPKKCLFLPVVKSCIWILRVKHIRNSYGTLSVLVIMISIWFRDKKRTKSKMCQENTISLC